MKSHTFSFVYFHKPKEIYISFPRSDIGSLSVCDGEFAAAKRHVCCLWRTPDDGVITYDKQKRTESTVVDALDPEEDAFLRSTPVGKNHISSRKSFSFREFWPVCRGPYSQSDEKNEIWFLFFARKPVSNISESVLSI